MSFPVGLFKSGAKSSKFSCGFMEILNFPVGFFLSVYKNGNFPVGFYSTLFLPCHIFLFIESLNLQNKAKSINSVNSLTMNKQYVKYCKIYKYAYKDKSN